MTIQTNNFDFDVAIIGCGIIGSSTAWQLNKLRSDLSILILDKESLPGQHQSGRNSGVVHAGVYYEPGSLKARFCKEGLEQTKIFCKQNKIEIKIPGKLIVATNQKEIKALDTLIERCKKNSIDFKLINQVELRQIEKNVSGLKAILVKDSAIVNYKSVLSQMLKLFKENGGYIHYNQTVEEIIEFNDHIEIITQRYNYKTRYLISCSGLSSDRIAHFLKKDLKFRIIPFRGEYYKLSAEKSNIVSHLIYPVPDINLPFLGIHLTPQIDGSITVGPNAVLSFKREGYKKYQFSLNDFLSMILYSGFWRLIFRFFKVGLIEYRNSLIKSFYLRQVQKYCPEIQSEDLNEWSSGVRAQAVSIKGELIHDFIIEETPRSVIICNAPSPAATSSIPIGKHLVNLILRKIN